MRALSLPLLGVTAFIGLSGCQQGTLFGEGTLFGDNRANIAGAASVVDTAVVEPISVGELITTINVAAGATPSGPETLDDAIVYYEARQGTSSPTISSPWARLRNTLQDRILLSSQSRCGFYEEYLKRFQSNSATLFGTLATVLGGAGAIVTGAEGARALAGAAGISSGVGAEMQKDLFASVTSTVIVPGIEKRRAAILKSILQNRCTTPDRYTIGLALVDALAFHSACSMDTGIAEGGNAIKQAANPGTAGLAAFMSLGGQINQAQSVRVSIDKNRKGAGGAATTGTSSIKTEVDASDTTVQGLLDNLNGGMSVSACTAATTSGAGAKPLASPAKPAAGAKPAAASSPTTPTAPATPTSPTPPKSN